MTASESDWQPGIEHVATSDRGLRRANNQDSFVVVTASTRRDWMRRGHLFMVADGMGAHAAGELASKMATDFISLDYCKSPDESPVDAIGKAFHEANERIHARGLENPDFRGMGTTSSVLLLLPEGACIAHVGDSRVYRLRGARFEQLSFDHSLVWEMQAIGKERADQIALNVPKNIITRSLGPNAQVQVDLEGPFPVAVGDRYLLCSDGLSGQVEDEELGCILGTLPPHEAVQTLIDLANLRGGPDNITAVIVAVTGPGAVGDASVDATSARATKSRDPVRPGWWIAIGVLALAALWMALVGQWIVAAGAAVAAAVVGLAIAVRSTSSSDGVRLTGAPLGKGPYVTVTCEPGPKIADQLAKVVQQLKDAASEEHWVVDWDRFHAFHQRAAAAIVRKDYAQVVREYSRAISFMMNELREQSQRRNGIAPQRPER